MIIENRICSKWKGCEKAEWREGYFVTLEQLTQLCKDFAIDFTIINDPKDYIKNKIKQME